MRGRFRWLLALLALLGALPRGASDPLALDLPLHRVKLSEETGEAVGTHAPTLSSVPGKLVEVVMQMSPKAA